MSEQKVLGGGVEEKQYWTSLPPVCVCECTRALQIDLGPGCSTVVFGSLEHIKGGEQIQ